MMKASAMRQGMLSGRTYLGSMPGMNIAMAEAAKAPRNEGAAQDVEGEAIAAVGFVWMISKALGKSSSHGRRSLSHRGRFDQ